MISNCNLYHIFNHENLLVMKICYLFFVWKIYSVFFSLYQLCLVFVIFFLSKTLSLNKFIYNACLSNCKMCSFLLIKPASAFSYLTKLFFSLVKSLCQLSFSYPFKTKLYSSYILLKFHVSDLIICVLWRCNVLC